jgi:Ca2+-binding RTX toxin-like protein
MYGTGNEVFTTSPVGNVGTVVMGLNNAADTVVGGSGASTVVGGSGKDVYGFVKGHAGGSEVIIGLKTTDVVAFDGYGSNPIASEVVKNGADVVTLTDGTSITFEGYDHKIFS